MYLIYARIESRIFFLDADADLCNDQVDLQLTCVANEDVVPRISPDLFVKILYRLHQYLNSFKVEEVQELFDHPQFYFHEAGIKSYGVDERAINFEWITL